MRLAFGQLPVPARLQRSSMGGMVSSEMHAARSAWELNHSQPFPGRKWGVELMCDPSALAVRDQDA